MRMTWSFQIPLPTVCALEAMKTGLIKRTWSLTDFGIIILLFQDHVGGLELEDRSRPGTFVPVTPVKVGLGQRSEMVVNISNTFQRWTNGVIKAGLHQVPAPPAFKASAAPDDILFERHSCSSKQAATPPLGRCLSLSQRTILHSMMRSQRWNTSKGRQRSSISHCDIAALYFAGRSCIFSCSKLT